VFEKILVPVDGSELGDRILVQVRRLLLTERARVVLVHVVSGERATAEPTTHLQNLRSQLEREGIRAESRLLTGEPAAAILDCAEDVNPSLIALSTHGRTGVERWVRGSVAERVLHASRFPLLLANPFVSGDSEDLGFRKILVPLDGSLESSKILPLVHDLARTYESGVVLAHVLELPAYLTPGEPLEAVAAEAQEARRDAAEAMLAHYRESLGGVAVRFKVTWGQPAAEVLDLAVREGVDLVALTTHGRSAPSRWLYGSVAENILRHVRSPVLVLRTTGLEELTRTPVEPSGESAEVGLERRH
jgi:nucleotide-binding universal stress UspA family protein